ncbi:S9 family peptidase [Candidatus Nephthysia bennettiae]|uniref:S9 family peptidase n=1 Tax=Candidatus Nephthysia bennettiae TaxID=3127016 RepID=A0A934NFF4_9BACT|nr:S9 family peptidase [Candidatus Dormibacteraeota bacterium]MBJ7612247.1 S9 family peptidase [Candidatus Dormibacteraeota bacterium]
MPPLTAEDLALFRWVDHVRLSPAGDQVAYQVSWADVDARQNRSRLVVQSLSAGAEPQELPSMGSRDHSPEWSPDGARLAFLSRQGPRDQLFVIDAEGAGAQDLTSIPDGVLAARWSPDGRQLAFLALVLSDPDGIVDDPRPPGDEERVRRPPVARVVRRLDYKRDGVGYLDGRRAHLFVVSPSGGNPRQLTSGAWDVEDFDWDSDGRRLAVIGDADPDADLRRDRKLYSVDLSGNLEQIAGGRRMLNPTWSPAGDLIAFVAPLSQDGGRHDRVWVVPAQGGEPTCLTATFDRGVGDSVLTDMRAGHANRLCWSEAGDRVLFQASGPGVVDICSVDLDGSVRTELAVGERVAYDFDLGKGRLVACLADPCSPGDVFLAHDGHESRLTDSNPWLGQRQLGRPRLLQFTAPDGLPLEGWLLEPPGLEAAQKRALVMQVHGGPHSQYGWSFLHEFQVLAGMGFCVFYLNPRGSDGYGEEFKRAVVMDWGGRDYEDLMSALDQLIERESFVDQSRMGVGGGSYGGYMTNWIIGHTDRFSAAVAMRSLSNLVSEYAQHDIVLWGQLEMGPPPWSDPEELWRRSPIRYVDRMRTPLLLTHGEMDLRCAVSQAEELFGALRLLGREVELVRFPGESHDLSRSGRPDRRLERLNRLTHWFASHLLEPADQKEQVAAPTP